jgi:ATP-binding cassette subfamily B protein
MQLANLQSLTGLLGALAGIFVLVAGAAMVQGGGLTTGRLMFVFTLSGLLLNPLEQLAASWFAFREAKVVLARYEEILKLPAEVAQDAAPRIPLRIGIRLEDVSFCYDPRHAVIENVTLDIPAGSTLAIVGESGAGKSTLLALLAGLYPPDKGRILVDGRDLTSLNLPDWRRTLGVVPQSPHLFQASIEENIRLGSSNLPPQSIRTAADIARASEFIESLPHGYSTGVTREGDCLSAGQVQRLAIARALARDPAVLLLDEATSNLDARTEEGLWFALRDRQPGRTTILVTHRLKSSSWSDRIAVLSDGRLVEFGTFDALMERRGHDFDLRKRQMPDDSRPAGEKKGLDVPVRSTV